MQEPRKFYALGTVECGHLILDRLQPEADFLEGQIVEVCLSIADKKQLVAFVEKQMAGS